MRSSFQPNTCMGIDPIAIPGCIRRSPGRPPTLPQASPPLKDRHGICVVRRFVPPVKPTSTMRDSTHSIGRPGDKNPPTDPRMRTIACTHLMGRTADCQELSKHSDGPSRHQASRSGRTRPRCAPSEESCESRGAGRPAVRRPPCVEPPTPRQYTEVMTNPVM